MEKPNEQTIYISDPERFDYTVGVYRTLHGSDNVFEVNKEVGYFKLKLTGVTDESN